jgi:hypothetical protein
MIIVAAVLLVVSIVGLIGAVIIGTPAPAHPKHGTFGVDGLDGSFIAWASVGLCALGLLLLFVDARIERRRPAPPEESEEMDHSVGDEFVRRARRREGPLARELSLDTTANTLSLRRQHAATMI